mgnify:CR=1 FL=1
MVWQVVVGRAVGRAYLTAALLGNGLMINKITKGLRDSQMAYHGNRYTDYVEDLEGSEGDEAADVEVFDYLWVIQLLIIAGLVICLKVTREKL